MMLLCDAVKKSGKVDIIFITLAVDIKRTIYSKAGGVDITEATIADSSGIGRITFYKKNLNISSGDIIRLTGGKTEKIRGETYFSTLGGTIEYVGDFFFCFSKTPNLAKELVVENKRKIE
eukprot:GHVP01016405.1.p1 GENE.GHVP01016405.1~~GHVP01016405.1.p1  ORF type:complete len:120 (-),score=24.25 GHVP01016405.1:718-1077(-)